ncbi:hypothetical protein DFH09DRAFT_210380 [Mycena vulgaris]|nr:hypothetical protein DFH09DRAFT_210380 [Mycena vulgaris]
MDLPTPTRKLPVAARLCGTYPPRRCRSPATGTFTIQDSRSTLHIVDGHRLHNLSFPCDACYLRPVHTTDMTASTPSANASPYRSRAWTTPPEHWRCVYLATGARRAQRAATTGTAKAAMVGDHSCSGGYGGGMEGWCARVGVLRCRWRHRPAPMLAGATKPLLRSRSGRRPYLLRAHALSPHPPRLLLLPPSLIAWRLHRLACRFRSKWG